MVSGNRERAKVGSGAVAAILSTFFLLITRKISPYVRPLAAHLGPFVPTGRGPKHIFCLGRARFKNCVQIYVNLGNPKS